MFFRFNFIFSDSASLLPNFSIPPRPTSSSTTATTRQDQPRSLHISTPSDICISTPPTISPNDSVTSLYIDSDEMAHESRRSVLKVPPHRRPSFMATASARRVYVQSDFARKQGPTFASNSDTFAYSPRFLVDWDMPQELWDQLPDKLTAELEGWQAAGAAVITGLSRLEKLDGDALVRGWPEKKSGHLSRTVSGTASSTSAMSPRVGAGTTAATASPWQTPPPSFHEGSASPISTKPRSAFLPKLQTALFETDETTLQAAHASSSALADTPPFTPEDNKGQNLPPIPEAFPTLDAHHLGELLFQYSANVTQGGPGSPVSDSLAPFDEGSWETFIGQYREEIQALKVHENVRFRHIRRGIDQLWSEIKHEHPNPDFEFWWQEMEYKQQVYDDKVQHLQIPDLEKVKAARIERGLHV